MARLLVVHHTPSAARQAMFEAAMDGTSADPEPGRELAATLAGGRAETAGP